MAAQNKISKQLRMVLALRLAHLLARDQCSVMSS